MTTEAIVDIRGRLLDGLQGVPGDFWSWESPQTLPTLFIGKFEHEERFRNLKFAVKKDHRHSEF